MVLEKGLVAQQGRNNNWNNDYYTFLNNDLSDNGADLFHISREGENGNILLFGKRGDMDNRKFFRYLAYGCVAPLANLFACKE